MLKVIKASELKVGYNVPETDGFIFEVKEILKETDKTITVRLINDTTIDKRCWNVNGGLTKTFRKTTNIYIQSYTTDLCLLLKDNEISQRTFNTLKRAGYNTLEEVKKNTAETIENIYNISKLSLKEINKCMLKYFDEYFSFQI